MRMPTVAGTTVSGGRIRLALVAGLVALTFVVGPLSHPTPAAAGTADNMEASLLSWINADRAKLGLVPLRLHRGLVDLAGDRAATMASTGVMEHLDCLGCVLNNRGIQWYGYGEVIAWTSWPWGSQAAQSLYNAWKGSSTHWPLLMSNRFNYLGIGVAYRSSNGRTYGAIDLTESVDQTRPWAKMRTASRQGNDVTWTWTGADTRLQTHTAGLKNFVVQLKVGSGDWRTIRTGTTATSITLTDRAGGRTYWLRVRSRDNRGYLSRWTAKVGVYVP